MSQPDQTGSQPARRIVPTVELSARRPANPADPLLPHPFDPSSADSPETESGERPIDVSVLVTVSERPGSLLELYRDFREPLLAAGYRCEFIFLVHPGYRDLTTSLGTETHPDATIDTILVGREVGETTLLRMGLGRSRGRILLTLPAYRQVQPSGIAELIAQVEAGADLAVGVRSPRQDPLLNRVQSALFHRAVGRIGGRPLHDLGCNARAIRRDVLMGLPLYGDFARFLPVLAVHRGHRLVEVPLTQDVRDRGTRVYAPGVYMRRAIDVLGLFFLLRFTEKPLRFFGLIGTTLAGAGGVMLIYLLIERLNQQGIGSRPLLLVAMLLVTLGVQAIALGLIGEIVVHLGSTGGSRRYRVRSTTPTPGQ